MKTIRKLKPNRTFPINTRKKRMQIENNNVKEML